MKQTKNKFLTLLITALIFTLISLCSISVYAVEELTVYLDETVENSGNGLTADTAVKTMTEALGKFIGGKTGTVRVVGSYDASASSFSDISTRGSVTIIGENSESVLLHGANDWIFTAPVNIDDIEIRMVAKGYKYIGGRGSDVEFGEGVEFTKDTGMPNFNISATSFIAKSKDENANVLDHTKLVMHSSNENVGVVNGTTGQANYAAVRVTNNSELEIHGGTYSTANIYGTGARAAVDANGYYHDAVIGGDLKLTVTGGTVSTNVAPLGTGYSTVKGNVYTTISGGTFAKGKTIYISSIEATDGYYIGGDAVMTISGGTFASGAVIGKAAQDNINGKEVYIYNNGMYDILSDGGVTLAYSSRLSSDTGLYELRCEQGLNVRFDAVNDKISVTLPDDKALYIDGQEQIVAGDGLYSVLNGTHTLSLGDISPNSITISFDVNCDDAYLAVPNSIGTKPTIVTELPAMENNRTGYNFLGWSDDKNSVEGVFTYTVTDETTTEVTLYAIWQPKAKYTIYFNDNLGGQPLNIDPITAYEGDTITLVNLPGVYSGNRVFNGWSEDAKAESGVYEYIVNSGTTLYGTWKVLNDITLPYTMFKNRVSGYGDSCILTAAEVDGINTYKLVPNPESEYNSGNVMAFDVYSIASSYNIDMNYYKYMTVNYFYDAGEDASSPGARIRFLNTLSGNNIDFNLKSGRWTSQVLEYPPINAEDGLLRQLHFYPYGFSQTAANTDGTEAFYLSSITFSVSEPENVLFDIDVYAENSPANTRIKYEDTDSTNSFVSISQRLSELGITAEYVSSFDVSLVNIESHEIASFDGKSVDVKVEAEYFADGTDISTLRAYLVNNDVITPLTSTVTDNCLVLSIASEGEIVFTNLAYDNIPNVGFEYSYDSKNGTVTVNVNLTSGAVTSSNFGFSYDPSMLTYSTFTENEGFTMFSSDNGGNITGAFSGKADASDGYVHIGDIVFDVSENFDETSALSSLVPDLDVDNVSSFGFWLGSDADGNDTMVSSSAPIKLLLKYGYLKGTVVTQREVGIAPIPQNYMKVVLYDDDGKVVEGFPKTIETENSASTVDFELTVDNGEYDVAIVKNGYLSKKVLDVPIYGGNVTDMGIIRLLQGDIIGDTSDIEGDGVVDIDDFIRILRSFSAELDTDICTFLDINEDGNNNVLDLAAVKANFGKRSDKEEIYGLPNPDYFNNTYTRLTKDKELNIGYMGGSITDGTVGGTEAICWRNKTTQWFRDNFPDAQITQIKASLGGTDTYLASYRMDKVLLDVATPDLVFIEYASNDYHEGNNYRSSARQLESIILKLRHANPNVDIIVIFSYRDFGGGPYVTQAVRGMWTMADYYGIKVMPLGYEAYEQYKDTWYVKNDGVVAPESVTSDGIHLAAFGQEYYTSRICDVFSSELIGSVSGRVRDTKTKAHIMPEKFHSNTLENSYMVLDMKEYLTENTTFTKNNGDFSWATNGFPNSYIGSYNTESGKGDIFEFKFTGTECAIVYAMMNDNAYISVKIDNGAPRYYTNKISGGNGSNPKTYRICQGLENKEHTVTIEVLGVRPSDSNGYNFRIGALLINPDDSAYTEELASPSFLRPDGTYEDVSVLADKDPLKTEWDEYMITDTCPQ